MEISHHKRKMERFMLNIPSSLSVHNNEQQFISMETANVCSSGAFFRTDQILPLGTEVSVDLRLTSEQAEKPDKSGVLISVTGFVIRIEKEGMAVCFNDNYKIRSLSAIIRC